jgi:AcrR family transcriptional regulator
MDLRRRILDAARTLLLDQGYDSVSMRGIARTVGVSATSLYLHFDSKDVLFQALVDEGMDRLHSMLKAAVTRVSREDRVSALCRAYIDFGLKNPEYYEVMFVARPRRMTRFPAENYRRARRNLDLLVEVLGTVDPSSHERERRVLATAMWAALHGVVALVNAKRVDRSVDEAELLATAVALVDPTRCETLHRASAGAAGMGEQS